MHVRFRGQSGRAAGVARFPVLTDTVDKVFSGHSIERLIRAKGPQRNNDSRRLMIGFFHCVDHRSHRLYQQYRPSADIGASFRFRLCSSDSAPCGESLAAMDKVTRKLAAILAADMVGYSRLIGLDEAGTIARQKAHRAELIDPKIAEYNGRIVKTTGDGLLAEFGSAVDAVLCAVGVQRSMAEREADVPEDRRIAYRVGINLGEIVIDDEDIFGDGVNVAARLEALAEPGGIRISDAVFQNVKGKLDLGFADLGAQKVKNIAEPISTFRVLLDPAAAGTIVSAKPKLKGQWRWSIGAVAVALLVAVVGLFWWHPWAPDVARASVARMKHPLPDKPSIAVLPFSNLSDDKDHSQFAEGVTEDIIADLSKVSGIFVVARNSTFKYQGKHVVARQVAEELGVRYVLDGNIRRAANKLQIRVRLVDAVKGRQLWADRYDREVKDIFAVQAEVTRRVVKALAVTLKANEVERLYRKHTTNIEAYELFLRARTTAFVPSKKNTEFAEKLFRRVIKLDPNFAGGYAGLALNYSMKARFQFSDTPAEDRKRSLELAKKAVQVDPNFAWSYIALGSAYLAHRDSDAAVDSVRQALIIQPNGYEANLWTGFYAHFAGDHGAAVEHLERANRISPIDTSRKVAFMAMAYFMKGDYAKSVRYWEKRFRAAPIGSPIPYVYMCAALELHGKSDEAAVLAAKYRALNPKFRLSKWRYIALYKSAADRKRLYEAAKRAGIPE